jgi:hypothetical protein
MNLQSLVAVVCTGTQYSMNSDLIVWSKENFAFLVLSIKKGEKQGNCDLFFDVIVTLKIRLSNAGIVPKP